MSWSLPLGIIFCLGAEYHCSCFRIVNRNLSCRKPTLSTSPKEDISVTSSNPSGTSWKKGQKECMDQGMGMGWHGILSSWYGTAIALMNSQQYNAFVYLCFCFLLWLARPYSRLYFLHCASPQPFWKLNTLCFRFVSISMPMFMPVHIVLIRYP